LLCTAFYLASLYYFLRLRLLKESPYMWLCVGCFLLSLLSKEMAVTLPAVATIFAFLTSPNRNAFAFNKNFCAGLIRKPTGIEIKALGVLWLTLLIFAGLRFLILSDAIGGYGHSGLSLLGSFANKAAMLKILAPANEEIIARSSNLLLASSIGYIGAGVFVLLRCLITPSLLRYFAAFALMGIVSLLPTFQVWNIAPNLCGSRLFFLSSAALALALAFALVPSEDEIDRKAAKIVSVIGTLLLTYQLCFFAVLVRENVKPFAKAGQLVKKISEQLTQLSNTGEKFLLLNLPTDFQGAPMITRPQYLKTMMSPPFSTTDVATKLSTAEIDPPVDRSIYSVEKLEEVENTSPEVRRMFWSESAGQILPWKKSDGASGFTCSFGDLSKRILTPTDVQVLDSKTWRVFNTRMPQIDQTTQGAQLYPNMHGLSLMLPVANTDPQRTKLIKIKMRVVSDQPVKQILPLIKLTWKQEFEVLSKTKEAPITQTADDSFECLMANSKEWLLGGNVTAVGLALLPGPYSVVLESIDAATEAKIKTD